MIKKFIKYFFYIPKSFYVSWRCFPLKKALSLPIVVSRKTKLGELHRNCITIEHGKLIFSNGGSSFICPNEHGFFSISKNSKIIIKGKATFYAGSRLYVDGGNLTIGNDFYMNRNGSIRCSNKIIIGDDVFIGWNVTIRDKDGHQIFINGERKKCDGDIKIGNHVWICSFCDIFKKSAINDGSVVAYRSLVNSKIEEKNVLIAGAPAKKIKENCTWEHK